MAFFRRLFRYFPFVRNLAPLEARPVEVEERYWDDYAARWQRTSPSGKAATLGADWNHADDFVTLLSRRGSSTMDALEVGCGGGRITAAALDLFRHVYAADVSSEMLRCCEERFRGRDVSFHKLDGFTLEGFADGSMDVLFAHDVFVQLSAIHVYPYLMEFQRVLRPGGVGMVSVYDFKDQFEMFKKTSLKFWSARRIADRRLHFVTQEMLEIMLQDLGLEVLEVHRGRFLTVAFKRTGPPSPAPPARGARTLNSADHERRKPTAGRPHQHRPAGRQR